MGDHVVADRSVLGDVCLDDPVEGVPLSLGYLRSVLRRIGAVLISPSPCRDYGTR